MYYLLLNDASMFEISELIEEGTTKLKGETLKSISVKIQNATVESIRSAFGSEFNTRTVKLLSENKIPMTVYNNYTILRSIATDEQCLLQDSENPLYVVTLAEPSDIGAIVPQLQARIAELEKELLAATADPDPSQMDLDTLKAYLVNLSNKNLETFLFENPITSTCHGGVAAKYTITLAKQTMLNNAIALCEIHEKLGDEYTPSWNAHNAECTYDWTKAELVQLAIEIEAFVKPYISKQQTMESEIRAAGSKEEASAVVITFKLPDTPVDTDSSSTESVE